MKTVKNLLLACDTEDKMAYVFNAALPNLINELAIVVKAG